MEHIYDPEIYPAQEIVRELSRPQPMVIGIEGGPCAGKSTLVESLQQSASERQVVCLPEVASSVISRLDEAGLVFTDLVMHDREAFLIVETEILGEISRSISEAVQAYAGTDTIIVADRCDIGAYLTDTEYRLVQERLGMDNPPLFSQIDKLVYLPSIARVNPDAYERLRTTNSARYEDTAMASETCRRNLAAVSGHPELAVRWGGDFKTTIDELTDAILHPEQEHEFKVEPYGDCKLSDVLHSAEFLTTLRITQSYHRIGETQYRLRQAVTERGVTSYWFTVKEGNGMQRHELQRRLDRTTYELLAEQPREGRVIYKERTQVLLNDAARPGVKRLWSVDRYVGELEGYWCMETDIDRTGGAMDILNQLPGLTVSKMDAKRLATGWA